MSKKVFVIGLDGASLDLIENWIDELPTFKRLINTSRYGKLESTIPPLTPCAWSSFITGKNPGKHGLFEFYSLGDNLELSVNFADKRNGKSLWSYLSDAGFDCCVFNVPFTYPPEKINGVMITSFTTPSLDSEFTYPVELKDYILSKFPRFKLIEDIKFSDNDEDKEKCWKEIFEITDIHAEVVFDMIKNNRWDFFMACFLGLDHIQHWFWKDMDINHPLFNKRNNEKYGNKILELYKKMDGIVGKIEGMLPEDCTLFIISDHGAGPYIKNVSINAWLKKNGYLFLKSSISQRFKYLLNYLNINPTSIMGILLKLKLGRKIKNLSLENKQRLIDKFLFSYKDIDWKKTKAYSFGYYGSIYLNKSSMSNYDGLREEIIDKLKNNLVDGGIPVVGCIWRKEEIYHGENLNKLPDILFSMMNFSYASSSMFAFGSSKVFSKPLTLKSGEHRLEGIIFIKGNGIKQGLIRGSSIVDVTPTIMSIMGLDINSDMDGNVLDIKT